ncbi:MAG: isoleucine--tRNA ligase [Myxococcota bacterium]
MNDRAAALPYPEAPAQVSFPEIETRVAARWRKERTFERSIESRPAGANGANEFVFYDGPPFANGLPHFGHLLTSYVKDVIPRYQTLRGRRVERRFGWDCHGLPAEMEAEKELGVSGRAAILEYGIARFNQHCERSVLKYTEQWQETITRAGRWVDFKNDYKTMDASYMESVMWAFKRLFELGHIYEGLRVLPYSWAAQTPVSNFETRMDNATRPKQDPAITVRFRLKPANPISRDLDPELTELWAWTTTPWTLPSNLALAVGPSLEYAVFALGKRKIVLGVECAAKYEKELAGAERVATLRGVDLVGSRYFPLFPYFAGADPNAFQVLSADFVDVAEGTGIVHMAPGFGEDDLAVCTAAGIAIVVPVDDAGKFTGSVSDWAGEHVFDANPKIIRALKERGDLIRHDTILHNYPHCWRTDTPLIYRAMSSWFVRVSEFKDRLVANNQKINWIPGHVRDGLFGNWLENARDWSISRNRFWGSPIPVWKSDNPKSTRIDVYGSIAELERDFGVPVTDLHRPAIDQLVRPDPDDPTGTFMMRRIPDVIDCWFESGSMPYAQVHYPFERKDWFEHHFPADFIVEYVAQTRGWFYTLHVLATALFDRPAFKNVICHGVTVDEEGQKLSKRLRNYPEPEEVFEKHGSDALRWYLMSSPILRGGDLRVEKDGKPIGDAVRAVLLPMWNAWHFFSLYANADGVTAREIASATNVLDRYALAKTRALVEDAQRALDAYDIAGACQSVTAHLDALNNWYIRRSRPRFWAAEKSADKQAAYDTLYTCLCALMRVASPLVPFLTDEIYRGLTGASVHLADWPDAGALLADAALVADMDRVRDVCGVAHAMRRAQNVRVRQPLAELTIAGPNAARLAAFTSLIEDEVNVKRVRSESAIEAFASFQLSVNARALGPRLGQEMKTVLAAAKQGQWTRGADGGVTVAGHQLVGEEFTLRLVPKPGVACQALDSGELIVVLDFTLTKELEQEGIARTLVRLIATERRDRKLDVSDRIRVWLVLEPAEREAAHAFSSYISESVLAIEVNPDVVLDQIDQPDRQNYTDARLDTLHAHIKIEKAT